MAERIYLTVGEVLQIHHQQIENYGGAHGLRKAHAQARIRELSNHS